MIVEAKIRRMLAASVELPSGAKYQAETYIEAGEYQLALDALGDWLVHHDLKPSDALLDEMAAVYAELRAEPRNVDYLRALP